MFNQASQTLHYRPISFIALKVTDKVSDICYRHVTDIYTDIITANITATLPPTLPPLPPTFLPQEKNLQKAPHSAYI